MINGEVAVVELGPIVSSAQGLALSPFLPSSPLFPLSDHWASSQNCDSHPLVPGQGTSHSNSFRIRSSGKCQAVVFKVLLPPVGDTEGQRRGPGPTDSWWQEQELGLLSLSISQVLSTSLAWRPAQAVFTPPLGSHFTFPSGVPSINLNSSALAHTNGGGDFGPFPMLFGF